MSETVARKRIEVLVDAPLAPRVIAVAQEAGITAHTLLAVLSGSGASGSWSDDQVTGALAKVMFVAITSDAKASAFITKVAPLLDTYGLMLVASDVQVVRGTKF